MKQSLVFSVVFAALLVSGCSTHQGMYEYADYSESFYGLKKDATPEAAGEWKNTLEESIKRSNARAIRIPPGINANLGYLYLKANDTAKAIVYFKAEKALYPESTVFMDKLIKKAELMNMDKDKS